MPKKNKQTRRHLPQRTCVGCRKVEGKRTLIRLVRTADAVLIDETGKQAGRGAYLHEKKTCWDQGLKGRIARALKTSLTKEDIARLTERSHSFPLIEE